LYRTAYGTIWSYNVSICIWYEMVIMYRSAYGTKWQWYEMVMVRTGFSLWYEMAGTKWLWYEMTVIHVNKEE
jgi:hypothetical protein